MVNNLFVGVLHPGHNFNATNQSKLSLTIWFPQHFNLYFQLVIAALFNFCCSNQNCSLTISVYQVSCTFMTCNKKMYAITLHLLIVFAVGPPFTLHFRVRFYAAEPQDLTEELTK